MLDSMISRRSSLVTMRSGRRHALLQLRPHIRPEAEQKVGLGLIDPRGDGQVGDGERENGEENESRKAPDVLEEQRRDAARREVYRHPLSLLQRDRGAA